MRERSAPGTYEVRPRSHHLVGCSNMPRIARIPRETKVTSMPTYPARPLGSGRLDVEKPLKAGDFQNSGRGRTHVDQCDILTRDLCLSPQPNQCA